MKLKKVVGWIEIVLGLFMIYLIFPITKFLYSLKEMSDVEAILQSWSNTQFAHPITGLIIIISALFILQGIVNLKKD